MPVHKGLIRRRPNVDKCTQSTACYQFHWMGPWIMIHFQYLLLVFVISLTKIFSSFSRNKYHMFLFKCTLFSRVKNYLEYLKLFSANLDRIRFLGCHTNNIWKAHERSLGHFINKLLFVAYLAVKPKKYCFSFHGWVQILIIKRTRGIKWLGQI